MHWELLHAGEKKQTNAKEVEDYLREKTTRQSNLVRKLPFSVTFFAVYAVAVLDHEHTSDSWGLQYELRGKIEGTKFDGVDFTSGHKTLFDLDNEGDFYMYLREAYIPHFIRELDAPKADRYRVLRYNQIIGGIQLQQVRRTQVTCSSEYPNLGPFPEAGRTNPILAGFDCFPWYSSSDECFGPGLRNRTEGFCPDSMPPAPRANVPGTSGRRLDYVPDGSGTGSRSRGTGLSGQEVYSTYLYEHEGQQAAVDKVLKLEEDGWIDLNTAWVGARVLVFNPEFAIFVHTTVNVYFPPSGALQAYFQAQTFVSEPYQMTSTLVLDMVFLALLLWHTLELLRKIYSASKGDRFIKLIVNGWTWMHIALVVGGFLIVIFWLMLLDLIVAGRNRVLDVKAAQPDVTFTSDTYPDLVVALHTQMAEISEFIATFRTWLGVFMLVTAGACLEAFAAQPRLAMLTETLFTAGSDLIHFMVVFMILFMAYVYSGMFIFGRRIWEFSSVQYAVPTCFLMLFGAFDWDLLKAEHPMTAGFWFWSFMVMAVLIMLNMLMAIIMDKYTAVKAEVLDSPAIWDQAAEMVNDSLGSKLGKRLSMVQILQRVEDMEGEVDLEILRDSIEGLTKDQAEELLDHTLNRIEIQHEKGVTMSKAMRMIGWVSIHVQKLNWSLDTLVQEEKDQLKMLTHQEESADADALALEPEPNDADAVTGSGVGGALVADVGGHLEDLELRMQRLETFMDEAIDFASFRGKDLANRMVVIEHLLKGQRDAVMSSPSSAWDGEPPSLRHPDISI